MRRIAETLYNHDENHVMRCSKSMYSSPSAFWINAFCERGAYRRDLGAVWQMCQSRDFIFCLPFSFCIADSNSSYLVVRWLIGTLCHWEHEGSNFMSAGAVRGELAGGLPQEMSIRQKLSLAVFSWHEPAMELCPQLSVLSYLCCR